MVCGKMGRACRFSFRSYLDTTCRAQQLIAIHTTNLYNGMDVLALENLHIFASGVFALDVPSRNFRSWSLVSCEKVYSLDSDWKC